MDDAAKSLLGCGLAAEGEAEAEGEVVAGGGAGEGAVPAEFGGDGEVLGFDVEAGGGGGAELGEGGAAGAAGEFGGVFGGTAGAVGALAGVEELVFAAAVGPGGAGAEVGAEAALGEAVFEEEGEVPGFDFVEGLEEVGVGGGAEAEGHGGVFAGGAEEGGEFDGEAVGEVVKGLSCCKSFVVAVFGRYSEGMSRQTTELLEAFDALPPEEKRVFTAEIFRRAIPFDSGPLDDAETAQAADELFALLDQEDDDAAAR